MLFATAIASCVDARGPVESATQQLSTAPFLVSNPTYSSSTLSAALIAPSATSAVYVSLLTGALPDAIKATVRVERTGVTITTAVVNGGFDPIVVAAVVGDMLVLTAIDADDMPTESRRIPVPAGRPPVIVRSEPPPHKRDVPLNVRLAIVFSEPVDVASLSNTLRLRQGNDFVDGRAYFGNAQQTLVEFELRQALLPDTDYELIVGPDIQDLDGWSLQASLSVPFKTVAPPPQDNATLVAAEFYLIEYQEPDAPDRWLYTPKLRLANVGFGGTASVLKFQFSIPGFGALPPLCATGLTITAGSSRNIFLESYGDYEVGLSSGSLNRTTAVRISAEITYQDAVGIKKLAIDGPIIPGSRSTLADGPSIGFSTCR